MNNITLETPFYFYILLVFLLAFIVFIIYIEPKINKHKISNKNEHGSSKFADFKEISKTFDKEDLHNINNAGFPVWFVKKNKEFQSVYFDNKSPHHLLVGSTGSGKSVTVVIPECLMFATAKEKKSVIVTDPKGEIFRATSKVFKDNGYDVITIDFRNPRQSVKINIMQPIIDEWKNHCRNYNDAIFYIAYLFKRTKIDFDKYLDDKDYNNENYKIIKLENHIMSFIDENRININKRINTSNFFRSSLLKQERGDKPLRRFLDSLSYNQIRDRIKKCLNQASIHEAEANRLTISLADLIFAEKETKDPFWITSSKNLFIGIVGIFLEDFRDGKIKEGQINIAGVKKFQNSSLIKANQSYLQKNINDRKYGCLSKDYLTSILSSAENTYKSVTAVFGSKTNIFDDLNVENITSVSEFEFTQLGKKPTALFIIVPDEDRSYFQLVTIIIGILYKDLVKFANMPENKGTLPVKIEWILDEFANCPPLDSIEAIVSVARSRGMQFQFFIQSFSQLEQVYGKETSSIIQDNCSLTYLKTNSYDCALAISNKLGKATIETNSISASTDPFKVGANQTVSLLGRELLTANEIINLKYKTIIFPTVSNPIFRDTYLYSDLFPMYKDLKPIRRKENLLKRLTDNYYTVDLMRKNEEDDFKSKNESEFEKINDNFDQIVTSKSRKNVYSNNNVLKFGQLLLNKMSFSKQISFHSMINNNVFQLKVDKLLNGNEKRKIINELDENTTVEIILNIPKKETIINIRESEKICEK